MMKNFILLFFIALLPFMATSQDVAADSVENNSGFELQISAGVSNFWEVDLNEQIVNFIPGTFTWGFRIDGLYVEDLEGAFDFAVGGFAERVNPMYYSRHPREPVYDPKANYTLGLIFEPRLNVFNFLQLTSGAELFYYTLTRSPHIDFFASADILITENINVSLWASKEFLSSDFSPRVYSPPGSVQGGLSIIYKF